MKIHAIFMIMATTFALSISNANAFECFRPEATTRDENEIAELRKAAEQLREAAEQGEAEAQFKLALCYAWGDGVRRDDKEAVFWLRKAAEQGHEWAQYNLGRHYERGRGVPQDDAEAARWYQKAAEQGNAEAQKALKEMQNINSVEKKIGVEE